MRVPDLKRLANAINNSHAVATASKGQVHFTAIPRRRRGFDLANAFLIATGSPGRTTPAERNVNQGLAERQTCASGLAYCVCGNGYTGCCATNPCNAGGECPVSLVERAVSAAQEASTSVSIATVTTIGGASNAARTTTTRKPTTTNAATTRAASTGTGAATASATTRPASSTVTPTPTPASPIASTATSTTTSEVPSSTADAQASTRNRNNVGPIAGGVVGGVVGLILILALVAFFVRRHRRIVDERRANWEREEMNKSVSGATPIFTGPTTHMRSQSTANDVLSLTGGSHYPPQHTRQRSPSPTPATDSADFSELEGHTSTPPGMRAERGRGNLPAAVLRPPQMLDGTPVKHPGLYSSTSRSSIFVEHVSEMEDTSHGPPVPLRRASPSSLDSPILGRPTTASTTSLADDARRRNHLLSWNEYDPKQATDDGQSQITGTMTPKTPPSGRTAHGSLGVTGSQGEDASTVETLKPTVYERPTKAPRRGWSLRRSKASW